MEEVLIQGDTAGVATLPVRRGPPGAAATAACGHRAGARLAPPGGGRGAGATAPESVPVRGQEPGGNNHGGYRGPS